MSSSTSGPDPEQSRPVGPEDQPGWGAPPPPPPTGGPGWVAAPPPGPGYGAPGPWSAAPGGYGAGQRPGQVTAAAIIGIVIGGIGSLFGLLGLFALGVLFEVSALLGLLFLLSVGTSVVLLYGGIQAIQGRSPRLLLLGSYASIGVQLLYTVFAMSYGEPWFSGLLSFVLPILTVFLLMQPRSREYYAARGISY
ncbi:hypothetical protein [Blastococcus tunisiensis]|uniref:Uncharacterized protein n=1 Tax=Blastococcus tunisiensis TaxID=1798228 RepID=A0A1I2CTZ9_9ACTN|nr:hypothetical protein [Blastococcus sp. DSM 46838]SFE71724.1 hypothetical protein SAMN05216574_105178 [Blastococcus sp. DSM 46838]